MKRLFCLPALLFALAVAAQQPFAKMVVGIEAGWNLIQYDNGVRPRLMPGAQVEYPWKKFSFGIGLTHKNYRSLRYETATGETEAGLLGEKKVLFHRVESRTFQPEYWSVPLRVNYRFPCNCVYLHAAASVDFLATDPAGTIAQSYVTTQKPTPEFRQEHALKSRLRTYEIGVGFKLHSSDYFRLVARPSYVWSENPEIGGPGPAFLRSLRMTFGAQYAFVRYGGKF